LKASPIAATMHPMRYAVIIAGGSGTRLWPMSRLLQPKQLLPLIQGRSLLEVAFGRLGTLLPAENILVCAAAADQPRIVQLLGIKEEQFLGEPVGRDTLPALAFSTAVIARRDPEAVVGVFTADHLIQPVEVFRAVVNAGYREIESRPDGLLTFGITPTRPATEYGYLELGGEVNAGAREVRRFKEKPDLATARRYLEQGPGRYLWNSGMFVWTARAFLRCVEQFEPEVHAEVQTAAQASQRPEGAATLAEVYPRLKRISVDYAIMEPASADPDIPVLALPMALDWRDIGSWSSYAEACIQDVSGNASPSARSALVDCSGTLVASTDPEHLIAAVGCDELIIVHTANATLICPKTRAEEIKDLQARVLAEHGEDYV
jgi:mannose-1-phosphate guanylyltransferase